MTPLQFEQRWSTDWDELERLLQQAEGLKRVPKRGEQQGTRQPVQAEKLAALYRRVCEHLALARARAYPPYLTNRLDALAHRAHQVIYRERDFGLRRVKRLLLIDFPQQVRALHWYVWIALLTFAGPLVALGLLVYFKPSFALSVVDAGTLNNYESMYGEAAQSIGRRRGAPDDWMMFGFYIMNNIGIGFQCFASGLFAGVGSLFFLAFNGVQIGVIAGYLTARDLSETFWSFVATHSSFELTAIVLSGAAGLRIGHALLAPGRRTRGAALLFAAREAIVIVYGVFVLLLIAAGVEAFWSSSRWIAPQVKYVSGAVCWVAVLAYLIFQGRPRGATKATEVTDAH